MIKFNIFWWLTCLIIFNFALNTVLADNIPCPNSPVPPIYVDQQLSPAAPTTQPCPPCPPCPCANSSPSHPALCPSCPPCANSCLLQPPSAPSVCCPSSPSYSVNCPSTLPTCPTICPNTPCAQQTPTNYPNTSPCPIYPPPPTICPSTSNCTNSPVAPTYPPPNCPTYPPSMPTCPPIVPPTVHNPTPTELPTIPPGEKREECPPGTLLVNGICRLVYCGKQSIYREGKCLQIECPEGTYWTGSRCEMTSEPIVHTLTFQSTINTHIDSSNSPIVINNVNNLTVNSTSTIDVSNETPATCEECETATEEVTNQSNCCIVVTPRICEPKIDGDRKKWDCYSKRYRRCGEICIAPIVYLKAPQPSGTDVMTIMPPENYFSDCRQSRTCADSDDMYDCSGCLARRPRNCSSYCYRYVCQTRRCKYYNQQDFCGQYPGEQGCSEADGCFDDWCNGNQ